MDIINNGRQQTVARIATVRWRFMVDELVDDETREYEIFRFHGRYWVRAPHGSVIDLGSFFTKDRVGQRIHQLYCRFDRRRLEDLDGATIDLYPYGAQRLGYGLLAVEGSELHGQELR